MKLSINLDPKWIGKKFGKLTVVSFGYDKKRQNNTWKCRCDCGNEIEVFPGNAKSGRVRSCGCAQIESATIHGQRYTRLYGIWVGMNRRCLNTNHPSYQNYGGRGISVCEDWRNFETFYEWAYANGYSDELSIDRKDVNGNYEPLNCQWATDKRQARNRRNTRLITVFGETLAVADAIEKYGKGINLNTVLKRMDKYGFSAEKALTAPLR